MIDIRPDTERKAALVQNIKMRHSPKHTAKEAAMALILNQTPRCKQLTKEEDSQSGGRTRQSREYHAVLLLRKEAQKKRLKLTR